jgi:hypothetical protein
MSSEDSDARGANPSAAGWALILIGAPLFLLGLAFLLSGSIYVVRMVMAQGLATGLARLAGVLAIGGVPTALGAWLYRLGLRQRPRP